jgi:hypothetical protein
VGLGGIFGIVNYNPGLANIIANPLYIVLTLCGLRLVAPSAEARNRVLRDTIQKKMAACCVDTSRGTIFLPSLVMEGYHGRSMTVYVYARVTRATLFLH